MKVDFIVVAYRNPVEDLLTLCRGLVESISLSGASGSIHLVLNDATELPDLPGVVVHQGHGNIGFARGVSLGLAATTADFCVIANPDCTPAPTTVAAFLAALRPGCGIMVPKLLDETGKFDYFAYENWTYSPDRKLAELRCRRGLTGAHSRVLPRYAKAPGAFLAMEVKTAKALGGPFDGAFFLYAEDRDLTDRARTLGVPLTFMPEIEIRHLGGVSSTSVAPLVSLSKCDGALRVAGRRHGRLGVFLSLLDHFLLYLRAAVKGVDTTNPTPVIRRWLRAGLRDPGALSEGDLLSMTRSDERSVEGSEHDLRALILWSDNSAANLGLRVLAQGSERLVRQSFPEHRVTVDCQDFGPGDSEVSFGTRAIVRDILGFNGPIRTKLARYNLIVDSGAGDSFTDIYGLKRLSFIAYAHWRIRRLGIPMIMGPQTIGPFRTRVGRLLARRSIHQAAAVIARDPESARYAAEVLGRPVDAVTTDLVFLLPPESPDASRDVIVNVSGLLWFGDDHVDSATYRRETEDLVLGLLAGGRRVTLLPHVVNSPSGNDDGDAIADLSRVLGEREHVEIVDPGSLDEVRAILASGQIVIGARMHACLNALSQGIPAIPWAYSRKFEPLLEAIGWDHVVDLRVSTSPAALTLRTLRCSEAELRADAARVSSRASQAMAAAFLTVSRVLEPRTPEMTAR